MKILITGVTGLIGQELALHYIKGGHDVFGLSRSNEVSFLPQNKIIIADLEQKLAAKQFAGFDVVIHLAGYPVADERWTDVIKAKIKKSRVDATANIVNAINQLVAVEKPKQFILGSAIGIYGDGFLAEVCREWEAQLNKLKDVPHATLRTAVVLARHGGALTKMPPVVVGSGDNKMCWIHLLDWVAACSYIVDKKQTGVFDLVAPQVVTQKEMVQALKKAKRVPLSLWSPRLFVNLGLGERAQVLFESLDVKPTKLDSLGFKFQYDNLEQALNEIYSDHNYLNQIFYTAQYIPADVQRVYEFFSEAKNLEKITPPFLNFKILSVSTNEIKKNTEINYKLKLHGLPVKWKTLIDSWSPPMHFSDLQLKGPYSLWHHTHVFYKLPQGTLMLDKVIYRIPIGILGLTFLQAFILKEVKTIFKYRLKVIREIFGH